MVHPMSKRALMGLGIMLVLLGLLVLACFPGDAAGQRVAVTGKDLSGGMVQYALEAELLARGVGVGEPGAFAFRVFASCAGPCDLPGAWLAVSVELVRPLSRGMVEWAYRDAHLLPAEHETSFGRLPPHEQRLHQWVGQVHGDAVGEWLRPIVAAVDAECLAPLRMAEQVARGEPATPIAMPHGWRICPPLGS